MIDYRTYEAEDFLLDESFKQWTLNDSPEASAFWESWLVQHPDRADVIRQAQQLTRNLAAFYQDDATDSRIQFELNQLIEKAIDRSDSVTEAPTFSLWRRSGWRWAAAATVFVTLGLGIWFYKQPGQFLNRPAGSYAQATDQATIPLLEKANDTKQTINVLLNDGSVVSLAPNSRLSYPAHFSNQSRTVYLSGEAFFDVVKNPSRPFLIYANQTVTKVLGTSFVVRAYENESDVLVTVRTGRVSVYVQDDFERARQSGTRQLRGVVLMPNQQVTYDLKADQLAKTLVDKPAALMATIPSREQTFDDMPIANILLAIERTYGVDLVFNEDDLLKCRATISFGEENLMERLDVICQTIGASFEVLDGQIVIDSKGCQ